MNRWYQVRRMRGAVYLILTGVLAMLNEWHILTWHQSWPLFLVAAGLLMLAERAAWTADVREQQRTQGAGPAGATYPGTTYSEQPAQSASWPAPAQGPLVQPHPPGPEDSGAEDR